MNTILHFIITNTQWMSYEGTNWSVFSPSHNVPVWSSSSIHHHLSQLLGHKRVRSSEEWIRARIDGSETPLACHHHHSSYSLTQYAVILTRQRWYIEPRQWSDLLRGISLLGIWSVSVSQPSLLLLSPLHRSTKRHILQPETRLVHLNSFLSVFVHSKGLWQIGGIWLSVTWPP